MWTAAKLETNILGLVRVQSHNQGLRQKDGTPTILADAFDPDAQREVLERLDLGSMFSRRDAQIVIHVEPTESAQSGGGAADRRAMTKASCYNELIIRHLVFSNAPFNGSTLHGIFQYRAFGDQPIATRSFTTIEDTALPASAQTSPADRDVVRAAIATAFQQQVEGFARMLAKQKAR